MYTIPFIFFFFSGWFEYGAIDDSIIEKLRDEEDVRVRLAGADELNRAIKESNLSWI